ncbi:MAG: hypothetical protein M1833_000272 [Piccolia ochrophora]|nr:MAG: hypothetical protein M1833_000272 [Piccolia ochrophora]
MFKKKPNIKPLAPLRSSDRRKTADQIIADLKIELPSSKAEGEHQSQDEQGRAASLSKLRHDLLPDDCLSARFTTTTGPDLKMVSGTVYAGAHPGKDQRILWVKIEERLVPTVYTLWHNPCIVPLLHTTSNVMQKLRGGADLMTPGLIDRPPFPPTATKSSLVAIADDENPTVPLVVGVCEIDVSGLRVVRGEKGKAVRGMHWAGDEIWDWSTGGMGGVVPPHTLEGWVSRDTRDNQPLDVATGDLTTDDREDQDDAGGVALTQDTSKLNIKKGAGSQESAHAAAEDEDYDEHELTTKEIDEAFKRAFTYGVYHYKATNKSDPSHGLSFPLSSSFIISNLVLPFLPAHTPGQAASLQIKKTSWKNAKKFIKHLEKEQLLKSKDRSGGETVVLDVDYEDRAVIEFVPYRLPKKGSTSNDTTKVASQTPGTEASADSSGKHLKRIGLYRPKEKLAPIFKSAHSGTKDFYLASELRPIITAYIESESLVTTNNKRLVKLDPVLANAVFDTKSAADREVLAKGTVPRDALIDRVIQACSPFWAVLRGDETKDDVKPRSGSAPPIKILLETRSGNKTVTKVSGLETYYINPQPLAEELQKTCASSTSVNQLVGSSPKDPVMEILVQGPQTQVVIKALEKRGVNRQWIDVVDKTKGKKR